MWGNPPQSPFAKGDLGGFEALQISFLPKSQLLAMVHISFLRFYNVSAVASRSRWAIQRWLMLAGPPFRRFVEGGGMMVVRKVSVGEERTSKGV